MAVGLTMRPLFHSCRIINSRGSPVRSTEAEDFHLLRESIVRFRLKVIFRFGSHLKMKSLSKLKLWLLNQSGPLQQIFPFCARNRHIRGDCSGFAFGIQHLAFMISTFNYAPETRSKRARSAELCACFSHDMLWFLLFSSGLSSLRSRKSRVRSGHLKLPFQSILYIQVFYIYKYKPAVNRTEKLYP